MAVCAYFGPETTFSGQFARRQFPGDELISIEGFGPLLDAVVGGKCDFAVAPLKNNNSGTVHQFQTEWVARRGRVFVTDLHVHPVEHHLYGKCSVSQIREARMMQPVLGQTKRWFAENAPNAHLVHEGYTNTVAAVLSIVDSQTADGFVAVGSEEAKVHGVPLIQSHIHNRPNGTTFCRIESKRPSADGASACLLAIFDYSDEQDEEIDSVLAENGCLHWLNWKVNTFPACRVFEVLSVIPDGLRNAQIEKIESQLKNSFFVGCYFQKTLKTVTVGRHQATHPNN